MHRMRGKKVTNQKWKKIHLVKNETQSNDQNQSVVVVIYHYPYNHQF